jgi:hypothetical protein
VPHLTELGDKDAALGTLDGSFAQDSLETKGLLETNTTTCLRPSSLVFGTHKSPHELTAIFLPLTREKYKAKLDDKPDSTEDAHGEPPGIGSVCIYMYITSPLTPS